MADNEFPVAPNPNNEQGETSQALTTTENNQPTSTDVAVATPEVDASSDDTESKASWFKSFFQDGEIVHRLIILGFLVIFVAAIIFAVISFTSPSKAPETQRKLGQYSTDEIGAVLDFLENDGYKYKLTGNNTIVVDAADCVLIVNPSADGFVAVKETQHILLPSVVAADNGIQRHLDAVEPFGELVFIQIYRRGIFSFRLIDYPIAAIGIIFGAIAVPVTDSRQVLSLEPNPVAKVKTVCCVV